jgi:type I restriction enzyme S subunit
MSGVAEVSPKYLADIATNGVPVGYKQTEVGEIPEDWKVTTVGKVVSITTGNKNTQDKVIDGLYPFFVRSQQVERINTYSFDGEGVLTAGDGVGTGKIFHHIDGKFDFHQRVYLMYNFGDELDGYYFYIYFSNNFYDRIMSMTAKSSVDSVRREMIADMLMVMPPKAEQIAIANALSDVDALISEQEKLIAKKQAIKTATMQQLLTGRTRLPQFALRENGTQKGTKHSELGEIPEDWEVVTLGDIGQTVIGLTYSPNDVADFGTLVLRSSNVQNGKLAYADNVYVNMELPERVIVKQGDILICVRNGSRQLIGKCALIDENAEGSAFGAFMSIFRTKYSVFVFYQFQSDLIQNQINEIMGATINQITNKDMSGFKITLPSDEKEQTAIATILSDMDAEIQALEQRLGKTRQIKQGMMQELLTGKTRLIKGEAHG